MSEEVVNKNEYPKWIDHPTKVDRVIKDGTEVMAKILVKDTKEEAVYYPKETKKVDWKK